MLLSGGNRAAARLERAAIAILEYSPQPLSDSGLDSGAEDEREGGAGGAAGGLGEFANGRE
jgi:hypothetical protein